MATQGFIIINRRLEREEAPCFYTGEVIGNSPVFSEDYKDAHIYTHAQAVTQVDTVLDLTAPIGGAKATDYDLIPYKEIA